ncbi:DegV family protein [Blautia sp.]|jgi:DegV family protein with EDD domain|uniref:DegV family protein n=1 Tax=Blautia sp. TaxID=1955243 RepID=UPI0029425BDF|nr:DegV family protein [Blautia sp.]MDY3017911.1 DegV family protein [Blautia sp.]MED9882756.1 DegV family protein [Blautia sp.]
MREYVITTDNNADLPVEYYKEHNVGCMYFSYTMDDVLYKQGSYMPEGEFYGKMRAGSMPTTAQVNPEEARLLFEPYLKEGKDILHIAFSSGLSGTYNSCRIAVEELREEYPDRIITIIDSLAASLGQGLLVYLTQKLKEEGADMQTAAEWAENHRKNIVHLFTVDDLNHLYRGGRVSKTTAVLGGMLNIKPILHVDDEGKLIPIGKVRGRKKSILELASLMDEKLGSHKDTCDTIFISHGDCLEDAKILAEKIKARYQINTEIINYVGSVIGAHSGPGTLALFFVGDLR